MRRKFLILLGFILAMMCAYMPALAEDADAKGTGTSKQEETLIPHLLPRADELPEGLQLHRPIAIYPGKKMLFDLIDGAGETHIRFGFRVALQAIYKWQDSEDTVILQIYEMDTDHNAYGLYTVQNFPESVDVKVGHEGNLQVSVLLFWKERFFVRLESTNADKKILDKVVGLGKRVAKRIPRMGSKPPLVELLPDRGQLPKTVRFFHHQRIFQNIDYTPYLGKENVLKLGEQVDVASARYRLPDKEEVALFAMKYPSATEAEAALTAYRKLAESAKAPREVKAGKVERTGACLVGLWGSSPPEALKLMDELILKIRKLSPSS